MDVAAELERTLERNTTMVQRVGPGDLDRPTPCEGWTIRDLLNHMIGGNRMFAAALRREEASVSGDQVGDDPAASYRASAEEAREAWGRPDALEGTIALPIGELPAARAQTTHFMDQTVHRWDLARALGVDPDIDETVASEALNMMKNLPDAMRGHGRPFDVAQPCAEDAPPWDRLAAWLGRDVTFAP